MVSLGKVEVFVYGFLSGAFGIDKVDIHLFHPAVQAIRQGKRRFGGRRPFNSQPGFECPTVIERQNLAVQAGIYRKPVCDTERGTGVG